MPLCGPFHSSTALPGRITNPTRPDCHRPRTRGRRRRSDEWHDPPVRPVRQQPPAR
ncbi:hypothetical protein SCOCK_250115 [Actinacidiphila cocklensis]|uniref:Uncharacterized protein n=1 Tax=Actinacidiphila cocklensis TaxID=887465 RepID=A0A9W4E716_9ACTN|nr:hypothetical protein SCOCK_250115 [Actinacidiphila cocklensis]